MTTIYHNNQGLARAALRPWLHEKEMVTRYGTIFVKSIYFNTDFEHVANILTTCHFILVHQASTHTSKNVYLRTAALQSASTIVAEIFFFRWMGILSVYSLSINLIMSDFCVVDLGIGHFVTWKSLNNSNVKYTLPIIAKKCA